MKFPGPLEIVEKVTSILDSLNIPYFISGSLASSLQGIPRATQDIDFIADINNTIIPKLIDAFKEEFYIDKLDLNYLKTQSEKYDLTILLEKVLDDSKLTKSIM